jgi:hypothetical protein
MTKARGSELLALSYRGIDGVFQIDAEGNVHVKSHFDDLGIGKMPVIRQSPFSFASERLLHANAGMIKFRLFRAQAHFAVTQTFAELQPREGHPQILTQMQEHLVR